MIPFSGFTNLVCRHSFRLSGLKIESSQGQNNSCRRTARTLCECHM